MFLERSHLRFDGVYVSRNTYIRTGITSGVPLVCYFRYCRFFPDGTLLYRTSPEPLARVAKTMQTRQYTAPARSRTSSESLHHGRFKLDGDTVYTAMRYNNSMATEVRSRMKLRSTVRGANNRLDIQSIVSYDREDGSVVPMNPVPPDAEVAGLDGVETRTYSRGMAPYIFVPWEQTATHILNLPVSQMDVFIAG